MSFSPTGGDNSTPPNPLAVFEGLFQGRGEREGKGKDGEGRKERDGREGREENTPKMNIWLRP